MRIGIRAHFTRILVLGSALLGLGFAACSLNPQPIPPGADSKLADAGLATTVPTDPNRISDAGTGGPPADASPALAGDGGTDSADADGGVTDAGVTDATIDDAGVTDATIDDGSAGN